jgi:hypothetical protein
MCTMTHGMSCARSVLQVKLTNSAVNAHDSMVHVDLRTAGVWLQEFKTCTE